ncbi:histidine phosphatase family protein [Jannaschia pohangensis]|uniref:Broad specificity phosphatase PhoE n=1 Tax=Jannaschia pohangensis TaxID=390807 RepID=A0A1I3QRB9_9RHOB|nr:histidine phosphatase family protein [Jannaschia pohangensis]SFJ36425.1 Broad specificity phosphatase PhoE [Jannaschia pohangensis]
MVRHAPTHAARMVGWTDLPADLSDAESLGSLHNSLPMAPIVSSDLARAVDTATAIAHGRPRLAHDSDLREFNYGDWEDQPFERIDSPALRAFFDAPGAIPAPGGESWDDVSARTCAAIDGLARGKDDLIVVTHMGVILTQWARATGLSPYRALAQKIDNLSVTRIDLAASGAVPIFANHHP